MDTLERWKQDRYGRQRDQDRFLDEEWASMRRTAFDERSPGETVATVLRFILVFAWNGLLVVVAAVVLYQLGKMVMG